MGSYGNVDFYTVYTFIFILQYTIYTHPYMDIKSISLIWKLDISVKTGQTHHVWSKAPAQPLNGPWGEIVNVNMIL